MCTPRTYRDAVEPLGCVQLGWVECSWKPRLAGCVRCLHVPVPGIAARVPVVRKGPHVEVNKRDKVGICKAGMNEGRRNGMSCVMI